MNVGEHYWSSEQSLGTAGMQPDSWKWKWKPISESKFNEKEIQLCPTKIGRGIWIKINLLGCSTVFLTLEWNTIHIKLW